MSIRKKVFIIPLTITGLIVSIYCYTWAETVERSKGFYEDALNFYSQEDLRKTIKGSEEVEEGEYVFYGGLQHVCTMWEGPLAWPKPRIYRDASERLDKIIDEEMSVNTGMQMFKIYFQLDRKYLDRILLRIGDMYLEEGKYRDAEEIYTNALEIFVHNTEVQAYAERQMERIAKHKKLGN